MPTTPDDPRDADTEVPRIAEMVAATSAPFKLGNDATHIKLAIQPPRSPALSGINNIPSRVFLKFENITSAKMAPSYNVFLNLPPGADPREHPESQVGVLAMFGLKESSKPSRKHPGNGLSYSVTVTGVFLRLLAMPDWDRKNLLVSFVPETWDDAINVQVGQVSLYYE